ncbi:MAG: hypothetical protein ACKV0T_11285 [Planctomycetales bacterium]
MEERLRFTGENPPVRLWSRYPNWKNAYEEEGFPGQDETTLRPADNQLTVDDDVSFTAGDAVLSNGKIVPAMLGVDSGELGWVYVYPEPSSDDCWMLSFNVPSQRWLAMNDVCLLQSGGMVGVPVGDSAVFPIRVNSRLPLERTGAIISMEIRDPGPADPDT